MKEINPKILLEQQQLIKKKNLTTFDNIEPFQKCHEIDHLITHKPFSKEMGCLLIAGGDGTRLNFQKPKGMFPILPNKTLFHIFAEKTIEASKQAKYLLPLAIMTSPSNHEQIIQFFENNNFLGLNKNQVYFFQQEELPFLNENGNTFLNEKNQTAMGPNGNGHALHQFYKSEIWQQWQKQGIKYVNFVFVDNPLADPFDQTLLKHHIENNNDVTIKCIKRKNKLEKVGVLIKNNNEIRVVEYTEKPNLDLKSYPYANTSMFCFNMDFIKKIANKKIPLHVNKKPTNSLNGKIEAYKFEYFIFDVLKYAKKTSAICFPRELCFAPLKNAKGENSPETVRKALEHH